MIDHNGYADTETKANMKGHLGDLGSDFISLSELQLELLTVDARDAMRESFLPSLLMILGVGLVVGACPVLLLGMSWYLSETTSLSLTGSLLSVALVGILAALALFYFAWKGLRKSIGLLKRSQTELRSNIQWIKKVLSNKNSCDASRF